MLMQTHVMIRRVGPFTTQLQQGQEIQNRTDAPGRQGGQRRMRAGGREHTCRPGRFDKTGSSLPPSSAPRGVPETIKGVVDEEHGTETPDAP